MADPERKQIKLTINMLSESQYQQLSADGRLSSELSDQLFMTAGDTGGGGTSSCGAGEYAEEINVNIGGLSATTGQYAEEISAQIGGLSAQSRDVSESISELQNMMQQMKMMLEQEGGNQNCLDWGMAISGHSIYSDNMPYDARVFVYPSIGQQSGNWGPALSVDGQAIRKSMLIPTAGNEYYNYNGTYHSIVNSYITDGTTRAFSNIGGFLDIGAGSSISAKGELNVGASNVYKITKYIVPFRYGRRSNKPADQVVFNLASLIDGTSLSTGYFSEIKTYCISSLPNYDYQYDYRGEASVPPFGREYPPILVNSLESSSQNIQTGGIKGTNKFRPLAEGGIVIGLKCVDGLGFEAHVPEFVKDEWQLASKSVTGGGYLTYTQSRYSVLAAEHNFTGEIKFSDLPVNNDLENKIVLANKDNWLYIAVHYRTREFGDLSIPETLTPNDLGIQLNVSKISGQIIVID